MRVYGRVAVFLAWSLLALAPLAGCGSKQESFVATGGAPRSADAGASHVNAKATSTDRCGTLEMDGDAVLEHTKDFTARFSVGAHYTKTLMLFGGDSITEDNTLSGAFIFGLDKADAQMLAQKYPDFYLCSSPGGQEASKYIVSYDLVPQTCDIYDQLIGAIKLYNANVTRGGDRTSLQLEGAPLQLEMVTADATGEDVTSQVKDHDFNLVTSVKQLTGQSVLSFGTTAH